MSLRDELLKAGLVSADKAKKQDSDTRKQDHQRKKSKTLVMEEAARQEEVRRQAAAEAARKRERDRQLNLEREAEKHRRELAARARQLIDSHRLNESDAEVLYNFLDSDGHWIRAIRVTPAQCKGLAMGQLSIVRGDRHEFDFALIPREIAIKLDEFAAERVLVLHARSENQVEEGNATNEETS
ncbi:MAG TPA: DUF2058 domain-containing protein [Gammaproteobacteria bacterium]|nr:DUF2058 domain-containing protein [Gammaproteobacteria bacterium]HRF42878.1 DUF2058 family protein [Candidatus Competibacteraceae bacterium]